MGLLLSSSVGREMGAAMAVPMPRAFEVKAWEGLKPPPRALCLLLSLPRALCLSGKKIPKSHFPNPNPSRSIAVDSRRSTPRRAPPWGALEAPWSTLCPRASNRDGSAPGDRAVRSSPPPAGARRGSSPSRWPSSDPIEHGHATRVRVRISHTLYPLPSCPSSSLRRRRYPAAAFLHAVAAPVT